MRTRMIIDFLNASERAITIKNKKRYSQLKMDAINLNIADQESSQTQY